MTLSKIIYKLFEKSHFQHDNFGGYKVKVFEFDENNNSNWFYVDDVEIYPQDYEEGPTIVLRVKKENNK